MAPSRARPLVGAGRVGRNPPRLPMTAIIVGLDSVPGLQAARILAWRGVPVVGLATRPDHPFARTRVCRRVLAVDCGARELIDRLRDLASSLTGDAALVPCTDAAVWRLSREREELPSCFVLSLPAHEWVERLMLKDRFAALATERGWSVPRTIVADSCAAAREAAVELGYPLVLKPPRRTVGWERVSTHKGYRIGERRELETILARVAGATDRLILQRWIPGGTDVLLSYNGLFDRAGREIAGFTARKLRQWPPETGSSSLGVSEIVPELRTLARDLFEGVGMRGPAYLEVKRDPRGGRLWILEANIGRPTFRSALAEASGVELHLAGYRDALGLPLPAARDQRSVPVRWIYWQADLLAALRQIRERGLGVGDYLDSLRGPRVCALWSARDPVPFLFAVGAAGRRRIAALRAR